MEEKKNDVISSPDHYKLAGLDVEVKDVIKSVLGTVGFLGFYKGNIIKYILRANKKNGLEDLKKARQYLDWLIEELDEDAYWDRQLSFLEDGALGPEESEELNRLNKKLMNTVSGLTDEEQERHKELISKKYGTIEEVRAEHRQKMDGEMNKDITLDEFNRELTLEESIELNDLSRKIMHSVIPLTKEEQEKRKELAEKMYGSEEEIKEEQRKNRENVLKLQEKLSKKVTK